MSYPPVIVDSEEFKKTFSEFQKEYEELVDQRISLETELNGISNKISHLKEVLNHLAPLSGVRVIPEDISTLGITDAIRSVLRASDERMSANDVRDALQGRNFDLSGFTAPMASIYKILSRLDDAEEVEREQEEGRVFYRWKRPVPFDASPITDEDIPF